MKGFIVMAKEHCYAVVDIKCIRVIIYCQEKLEYAANNEKPVIIYLPSCCLKPVCCYYCCGTLKDASSLNSFPYSNIFFVTAVTVSLSIV